MAAKALLPVTYRDTTSSPSIDGCYLRSGALASLDNTEGAQVRIIVDGDHLLNLPSYRVAYVAVTNGTTEMVVLEIANLPDTSEFQFRLLRPGMAASYQSAITVAQSSFVSGTMYSLTFGLTTSSTWIRVFEMGNTTAIVDHSPGAPWVAPPNTTGFFVSANERLNGTTSIRAAGPIDVIEVWDQTHTLTTTEASSFVVDVSADANVLYAWDMEVVGSNPGTVGYHKGGVNITVFETVTTDWTNPAGIYEYTSGSPAGFTVAGADGVSATDSAVTPNTTVTNIDTVAPSDTGYWVFGVDLPSDLVAATDSAVMLVAGGPAGGITTSHLDSMVGVDTSILLVGTVGQLQTGRRVGAAGSIRRLMTILSENG